MLEVSIMPTIRDLRETKGWNQEELSRNSDVTVGVISRAENGKAISRNSFRRICKALGVQPIVLLSSVKVRGLNTTEGKDGNSEP